MSEIIQSLTPAPVLPKCSLFEYVFPSARSRQYSPAARVDEASVAFVDGLTDRKLTRGQVKENALRLAGGLKNMGLKHGDVACIHGLNSLEWINAMMGCQAARVITSPANFVYTPPELLHQLKDAGASVVFVDPTLLHNVHSALKLDGAPNIPTDRIILLCQAANRPPALAGYKCIQEIWSDPTEMVPLKEGEEHETASLLYSSGTTGRAKGVETTHYNFTSQLQALNASMEPLNPAKDVAIGFLPFGHAYLFSTGILQNLSIGVPMVVLPRFSELEMLKAIQKYRVTWSLIVPPVLITLNNSKIAKSYDLSSLRAVMSAAAPLGNEVTEAFEAKFGVAITQAYGLTEISPISHVMTVAESRTRMGKVGRLLPTLEARLVPIDGTAAGPVERGELWVRGPCVMKGYWRNPTATENTFADGRWFKTGDVAVLDSEGYMTIVDRVKELIKYNGFQVPPAELEALLLSNEKVADVAVIGVYSKKLGTELPRAYIVPAAALDSLSPSQRQALSKEVADWLATSVAPHKRLRGGVILLDAIPKSPSGKILRKDLRVLAEQEDPEPKAKL